MRRIELHSREKEIKELMHIHYRETLELKEKYDVLSRDVAEIKIKVNAG